MRELRNGEIIALEFKDIKNRLITIGEEWRQYDEKYYIEKIVPICDVNNESHILGYHVYAKYNKLLGYFHGTSIHCAIFYIEPIDKKA